VNNAALMNFEPVAVLFLAWAILDQAVAPLQIAGAAIVIGAIVAMATGKR
jgi:drug/metabolite transporter (DMT)-like permease